MLVLSDHKRSSKKISTISKEPRKKSICNFDADNRLQGNIIVSTAEKSGMRKEKNSFSLGKVEMETK